MSKAALIKMLSPLDCRYFDKINKFLISFSQPDFAEIKIIFQIDDDYFYFPDGVFTKFDGDISIDSILLDGNSPRQLLALDNITAFVGKRIFPIIAMRSPDSDTNTYPKIKIELECTSTADIYREVRFSPVFELVNNCRIDKIVESQTTLAHATAISEARIKKISGEWSEWAHHTTFTGQTATAIQYRTTYTVAELDGNDRATINYLKLFYNDDYTKTSADFVEFVTVPQTFTDNLNICFAMIKHDDCQDTTVTAKVSFEPTATYYDNIYCGTGSEIVLAEVFAQDSLTITRGDETVSDFYFNTAQKTIWLDNPDFKKVYVSYKNCPPENWLDMSCDVNEPNSKRFTYIGSGNKTARTKFIFEKANGDISGTLTADNPCVIELPINYVNFYNFTCNAPYRIEDHTAFIKMDYNSTADYSYDVYGTIGKTIAYIVGYSA